MKINKELIEKVAENARLELGESEIQELLSSFKEILESFSKLDKANTSKVMPSFIPIEIKNVFREDKIEACLKQEEALSNTKHKKDGYFKGPRVV